MVGPSAADRAAILPSAVSSTAWPFSRPRTPCRDEVHVADEPRDELVARRMIDLARAPHLDDAPVIHHRDLVPDLQRLGLVVGDIDRGQSEPVHQRAQLRPQPDLELVVQVAERLVHQQDLGPEREGARQRDALLLAAAQRGHRPFLHAVEAEQRQHFLHASADRVAVELLHALAQRERDVLVHVHVRPDRVGLEHHGDGTAVGGDERAAPDREHGGSINGDVALVRLLQPGDRTQHGRLAAAAWAEQHEELALCDIEVDVLQRLIGGVTEAERLCQATNLKHAGPSRFATTDCWAAASLPNHGSAGHGDRQGAAARGV